MTQLELFGVLRSPAYPALPSTSAAADSARILATVLEARACPSDAVDLAQRLGVLTRYVEGILDELATHGLITRLDYQPPGPPGTPREVRYCGPRDADYWRRTSASRTKQNNDLLLRMHAA